MERLIRHYQVLCLVLFSSVHFYVYCSLSSSSFPSYSPNSTHLCPFEQSLALLQFKNSFFVSSKPDSYCDGSQPKTMSWTEGSDCCSWHGVTCDKLTGNVIGLDLACSWLHGTIQQNSSLFYLSHLQWLNLAFNNFSHYQMSPQFGRFRELKYLNLSYSQFSGPVPSEISQLSKLHVLDLSVRLENRITINQQNFDLLAQNLTRLSVLNLEGVCMSSVKAYSLSNLSFSVTVLDIGFVDMRGKIPDEFFHLPKLKEVYFLVNDGLTIDPPKSNWTSPLRILDLSFLNFNREIPDSIGSLKFLEVINIASSNVRGLVPTSFGNLTRITHIDFSGNNISGQFPDIFVNLTKLNNLYLYDNNFSGPVPPSIFTLPQLDELIFRSNHLSGPLPHRVSGLSNLINLDLSDNFFNGKVPSWLFTLPSLETINLEHNELSGLIDQFKLPNSLTEVNMSNNKLDGSIPRSFFELVNLTTIDLSSNNLSGIVQLEMLTKLENLESLDLSKNSLLSLGSNCNSNVSYTLSNLYSLKLSSCNINEFPSFLETLNNLEELDLSGNKIYGRILKSKSKGWTGLTSLNLSDNFVTSIDHHPWENINILDLRNNALQGSLTVPPPTTTVFFVANNELTGHIPSSICSLTSLEYLDLSNNNLSGEIPHCLGSVKLMLHLQRNNLHGGIPNTFAKWSTLVSLDFSSNELEGPLPRSLAHCSKLEVIKVGNNKMSDTFPYWLGALSELMVLVLRGNRFYGNMAGSNVSFCFFNLRIIDISSNQFTGILPKTFFENLRAMMNVPNDKFGVRYIGNEYYQDSVTVKMKGNDSNLYKIITLFTAIDLSNNRFEGVIPEVLGSLKYLVVLNLANNSLTGTIPLSLGNSEALESLDLSSNKLHGRIPVQLKSLNFLSALNVSHNQLSGLIPQGGQFDTFPISSFTGNLRLCGVQISVICGKDGVVSPPVSQEEDDKTNGLDWKIPLMGYGSGLVIGLSTGNIVFSTGKPRWFVRLFERERRRNIMRSS